MNEFMNKKLINDLGSQSVSEAFNLEFWVFSKYTSLCLITQTDMFVLEFLAFEGSGG